MMSSKIFLYTILLLTSISNSIGYRFNCLHFNESSCQCDTEEELIDCNSLGLTVFPTLKTRLRGYTVWTLAFNNISGPLPNERQLIKHLPDLQLIDLRGNRRLDCAEILAKFDRINVHSHCMEDEMRPYPTHPTLQTTADPTDQQPCTNFWCRLERGVNRAWLKTYAHLNHAWQRVKQKWELLKEKMCESSRQRDRQGLFEITR